MYVIDPLRIKIQKLLEEGQSNPLNQARLRYGTIDDLERLMDEIVTIKTHKRKYFFIDFTPFERIGHPEEFLLKFSECQNPRPVLLIVSEIIMAEFSKHDHLEIPPIVKFDNKGNYEKICVGTQSDSIFKDNIIKDVRRDGSSADLVLFRKQATEQNLIRLLFDPPCLDIPRSTDKENSVVFISGRYYRVMSNRMLVSCYLNLKEFGKKQETLIKIAYEIVLNIFQFFKRDTNALQDFDLIVVPNNTALFISSTVQAIIDKPIICIDRLGPIPALNLHSKTLSKALYEKKVILIEEVVATGSEVDRAIFFLKYMKASVEKIIAVYNLEVGMPMLIKGDKIISLCKPKAELKYEYRSQ